MSCEAGISPKLEIIRINLYSSKYVDDKMVLKITIIQPLKMCVCTYGVENLKMVN